MSEGAMTKEEFVQGMKTLREEAAAKEEARKAKQREYNRMYAQRRKEKAKESAEKVEEPAEKVEEAEAVADPEGVELTREEAAMLSQYIKDTICHALDGDYYFNETMIFDLVHLADRLGGMQ